MPPACSSRRRSRWNWSVSPCQIPSYSPATRYRGQARSGCTSDPVRPAGSDAARPVSAARRARIGPALPTPEPTARRRRRGRTPTRPAAIRVHRPVLSRYVDNSPWLTRSRPSSPSTIGTASTAGSQLARSHAVRATDVRSESALRHDLVLAEAATDAPERRCATRSGHPPARLREPRCPARPRAGRRGETPPSGPPQPLRVAGSSIAARQVSVVIIGDARVGVDVVAFADPRGAAQLFLGEQVHDARRRCLEKPGIPTRTVDAEFSAHHQACPARRVRR